MKITITMLRRAHACADQVALFERLFGLETEVTIPACVAVADKFNWDWVSEHLLSTSALLAYEEAVAPALLAYDEVTMPARRVYDKAVATAHRAFYKASAAAHCAYNKARATAFARAALAGGTGGGK